MTASGVFLFDYAASLIVVAERINVILVNGGKSSACWPPCVEIFDCHTHFLSLLLVGDIRARLERVLES